MNQQLIPLVLGAGLALMMGWWLSRRIAPPGPRRTLLRIGSLVTIIALVGLGSVSIANSQTTGNTDDETLIVPAEIMTVSTGDLAVTLSAAGSLQPADEKDLSFSTSAPVFEALVEVGDVVSTGDVLATLDTTDLEAQVHSAEIALAEAQAARDALVAPATDLEIEIAETSVEAAQASLSSGSLNGPSDMDEEIARLELELAKNQLWQTQINRDVRLSANPEFRGANAYAEEVTTNTNVENQSLNVQAAQTEYEAIQEEGPDASSLASANAQLENAQAELDSFLNGPSDAELRKADIDIENAQLDLDNAQRQLNDAVLTAPFDGLIASENLTVGELPPADEAAITLIDLSQYTVSLSIDETDVVELALGQSVQLDIQAIDNADVTGRITYIDLAPTASGELVTYSTEVTLDPTDAVLRPGMSTVASIVLDSLDDVIVVPNRFIETDPVTQQTIVMVQTSPGTYQATPVTLGLRTLEASQIVDGIDAGQIIAVLSDGEKEAETSAGLAIPGLPGSGDGGGPASGGPPGGF